MPPYSVSAVRNSPYLHPFSPINPKEIAMRTKISETFPDAMSEDVRFQLCKDAHIRVFS